MSSLLFEVTIEIFRAVVTGSIFFYLYYLGKKNDLKKQPGWLFICSGFGLLLLGTLIDITDNFPVLDRFVVIGETGAEAFLEKVLGYTLGFFLLAVGFWKWLPAILGLREARQSLKESEERFRAISNSAVDGIALTRLSDRRFHFSNDSFCKAVGYSSEELRRMSIEAVHPPQTIPLLRMSLEQYVAGETYAVREIPMLRKDGTVFYADIKSAFTTIQGVDYIVGFFSDITERKRTEEKLIESEEKFKSIFENAADAILIADMETNRIISGNALACRMLGCGLEELVGLDIRNLHPPNDLPYVMEKFNKQAAGEISLATNIPIKRKDGSVCFVDTNSFFITIGGKKYLAGIFRDITERRKAEKEIRDRAQEWQKTFDALADPLFLLDMESRITRCNAAAERFFGKTREQLIGRPCWEMVHGASRSIPDCPLSRLKNTLKRESLVLPEGNRVLQITVDPLLDEEGNFAGAVHIIEDISDRKKTEEELLKARNLESLGFLAGGIAHDFNNLLHGILGNIGMAKLDTPASSKAFEYLESAEKLYSVASGLTNQLLAFATGGVSTRETIQPGEFIRETVSFSLSGSNVKAVFDIVGDLHGVNVDKGQFHRVLSNIVCNARDAMAAGGLVLVKAENELINKESGKAFLKPGAYVRISIQDHGVGIPRQNLSRIFDPYFSTKERGRQKGMGLGLPICDTIIRKHGGSIEVDSAIGKGTTFHIRLPAVVAATAGGAPKTVPDKVQAEDGIRILIMDDEPAVFEVVVNFLKLSGFRVDSFVNADEAIQAYKSALAAGDPYAVAILDITIPGGMGGKEAIAILRRIDPGVKAIVSSGYANDPVFTDHSAYGFTAGIAKPYRLEALKKTIGDILAGC